MSIDKIYAYLMRLVFIIMVAVFVIEGNYNKVMSISLALLLTLIPSMIETTFKTKMTLLGKLMYYTFIFGSMCLGNVFGFYSRIKYWDKLLHLLSGIILASVGVSIVREKEYVSYTDIILFTILFVIAAGAVWEIYEFTMDSLFKLNTQRWMFNPTLPNNANIGISVRGPGLIDTMSDMIIGIVGGILGCFIESCYLLKNRRK